MTTNTIEKLNAKDIYSLFQTLYQEKYGFEYKGVGFIGNEMHNLREILDEHGSPHVACAVLNCIASNDRTVNIPYFAAGIKYYIVPYNPIIYWCVKRFGTPEILKLWKRFLFLDSVWLPSATQRKKCKTIIQELKVWSYEKADKKIRKTKTKKETKRNTY